MTKKELQKELEIYMFRIMHALDYFKMYKNMLTLSFENDNSKKISSFINLTSSSLIRTAVNETYLLLDNRNDKNIFKFIEICKQNNILFRKELTEEYVNCKTGEREIFVLEKTNIIKELNNFESDLAKYNSQISNLKALRDKIYAHVDKKYFYDNKLITKEYSVKYQDVEDILHILYKNMNRISVILTGTIYGECEDYIDDFKVILDSIK